MAEETTLEKMERLCRARNEAQRADEAASELLKTLSSGSAANIDGARVKLVGNGRVAVYGKLDPRDESRETETVFSVRQFRGLMGWGRRHVGDPSTGSGSSRAGPRGDGPNSKTPE